MSVDKSVVYRATCHRVTGHAHFSNETEAKSWAKVHIKGFDKIVVEKREGENWKAVETFSHR